MKYRICAWCIAGLSLTFSLYGTEYCLKKLDVSTPNFHRQVIAVQKQISPQAGTIALDFTPRFSRSNGKRAIYRIFRIGNLHAGINTYPPNRTVVWLLMAQSKSSYGIFKDFALKRGQKYHLDFTWNAKELAILVDGKPIAVKGLDAPLPLGPEIIFAPYQKEAPDGLIENVQLSPTYAILPTAQAQSTRPGCPAQLFYIQDRPNYASAILSCPDAPSTLTFAPRQLKIRPGDQFWAESSTFDPQIITAVVPGQLQLHYPACHYNQVTISPTGKNLLPDGGFEASPTRGRNWRLFVNDQPLPTLNQGHEGFSVADVIKKSSKPATNGFEFAAPSRTGNCALRLLKRAPQGALIARSVHVPVLPGKKYLLTGFYHTVNLAFGSGTHLIAELVADQEPNRYFYAIVMPRPTDWHKWRMAFSEIQIPPGIKNPRLSIIITATGRPFEISWDNLDLRERPVMLPVKTCPGLGEQMKPIISVKKLREKLQKTTPYTAERRVINGVPQLLLNGQVAPKFGYYGFLRPGHKDFAQRGVNLHWLYQISGHAGRHNWRGSPTWLGAKKYDFAPLDRKLEKLLMLAPDAVVMLSVELSPYLKFSSEHPEEVQIDLRGKKQVNENSFWISYAAPAYRRAVQDYLRALAGHLKTSLYGKVVAGIHLVGGEDGQWFPHAYDGSPANQQAFADWLKKRYHNDLKALRRAWQDSRITFETVSIPRPDEQKGIYFLSPEKSGHQRLIDGERFRNEAPVETVEIFARTFKQAMGRPVYTSVYYNDVSAGFDLGKNAVGKLLESPWIDGYVGVVDYGWARLPGFSGSATCLLDSATLHGKITLGELDYRTDYSSRWQPRGARRFGPVTVGNTHGDRENLYQQRRDMGIFLSHGQGAWMFALANNGWAHPRMLNAIEESLEAATTAARQPRREDAGEVAFFLDEKMMDLYGWGKSSIPFRKLVHQLSGTNARFPFYYSGLKVDYYLLSDLTRPGRRDYAMYVFVASPAMTAREVDWIQRNLQKKGRTLIFLFDAARTAPGGLTANILKLTGIKVRLDEKQIITYRFKPDPLPDPLAQGLRFLRTETRGPAFIVEDKNASPLGIYQNTNLVGAAVRRHPDWTGIYIGAPGGLTPDFLRDAAKLCGIAPVGPSGDATYAGNGFITVHAVKSGYKTLNWRGKYDLQDLADGQILIRDANQATIYMSAGETRIFYLKSRDI